MGLEAGAAQQPSEDSSDLVMPSHHDLEQPCALRGKGPWEVTELVRNIIDWLANVDKKNRVPLPFVLEQIDDSSKLSVITLKKGESALLSDLCDNFQIDPTKPYAACPDLFGDVSERVGIWSLAVAVIRSVTTMSEDQLRRFWSTPEISLPDSQGKYSAPEQGRFYFNSLQKEYPTIKPYLPWLKRALSVEANSRFNSISEASDYWDTAVLSQPDKQTLPKGEVQVVRGWSFIGTKVTKKFEGELSLDSSGRFFCVVEKGVVKVFEISPIPSRRNPFILLSQKKVGDFGTSSIDWDRWEKFVSGTSEQGTAWRIDLPTKAHNRFIWVRDHLVRNDDPMRAVRDFCDDWASMSSSKEERENRKRQIQEMRETKAWQEKHDLYQINGTVDVEPGKEHVLIKAKLRIDEVQYKLPTLRVDIGERYSHIEPFCTARWCGFIMKDRSTNPSSTNHLFLVDRTFGALHRYRFSFSDFEVNEHFLVGIDNRKGEGKITVLW